MKMHSTLEMDGVEIRMSSKARFVVANAKLIFEKDRPLITLRGDNGVGKTSFLNVLSGFLRVFRGRISFNGTELSSLRARQATRLGILRGFQLPLLCDELTVWENIALPGLSPWWSKPSNKKNSITEHLKGLGIVEIDRSPAELSFGQRRLIEMLRIEEQSKHVQPRLLLLDEPLAGLDVIRRGKVSEIIGNIIARGVPTILVEHDANLDCFKGLSREVALVAQDDRLHFVC